MSLTDSILAEIQNLARDYHDPSRREETERRILATLDVLVTLIPADSTLGRAARAALVVLKALEPLDNGVGVK